MNRLGVTRQRWLEAVERSNKLDPVAKKVRRPAQRAIRPTPLRRLLSGTDLGHPAHPMLVQLPIGLWTSAWVMDLTGLGKTKMARSLVGLGVLTALPAVASGVSEWIDTDEGEAAWAWCMRRPMLQPWSVFPCRGGDASTRGTVERSGP